MRRVFSLHLFLCSVLSPCLFAFPQSLSLALCVPGFLTLVLCLPSCVCLLPPLPCILSVCFSVCVLDFLFYFDSHSACVHYVQFCFTCVMVNLRSSVSGSSKNVASVKMQMLYWTVNGLFLKSVETSLAFYEEGVLFNRWVWRAANC